MKGFYHKFAKYLLAFFTLYFCLNFPSQAQNQPLKSRRINEFITHSSFNSHRGSFLKEKKIAPFKLIKLPFPIDALEPYISEETLKYHYGKHHQGYVDKLNSLIAGTRMAYETLDDLIKNESGVVFNNAAQIWNHDFYWHCLTPNSTKKPEGKLLKAIEKKFGSFDEFKKSFKSKAVNNFGSGWTWLIKDKKGELVIINTSNAGNPIREGQRPLLTCDVWEHAYYIDYRSARGTYIDNFWNIANWKFAEKNYRE